MRPSLRFLALAVIGWAGFRIGTIGTLPDLQLFHAGLAGTKVLPVAQTRFPAIEPVQPATSLVPAQQAPLKQVVISEPAREVRYVRGVVGVPVAMRRGVVTVYQLPAATRSVGAAPAVAANPFTAALPSYTPASYSFLPSLGQGPLSLLSSAAAPVSRPAGSVPEESVPLLEPKRVKRLQLTSWALLRSQRTGIAGSQSLAPLGQLGASQAGARLLYNFNRWIALSARLSTPVGTRGGEGAAGVRLQPLLDFPVWVTAERRQAIGRFGGGRSAFALLIEGGVYERPLPWRFSLDSYFQAGVVSAKRHDLFVDAALTLTRPLFKRVSAGLGVWGGAQPHLARFDVGPRVTLKVRNNMKLHLDWRQKIAGKARPGSGPALTLASDF